MGRCREVCSKIPLSTVVLIICSLICLWQLIILLYGFFNGEKWSTTQIIHEKPTIEFPNITICNFNRINKARASFYNLTNPQLLPLLSNGLKNKWKSSYDLYSSAVTLEDYMYMMVLYGGTSFKPLTIVPHSDMKKDSKLKYARKFYKAYKKHNPGMNITNLAFNLAHPCEKSLIYCQFGGFSLGGSQECCRTHRMIPTDNGVCIEHAPAASTTDGIIRQTYSGIRGGYSLIYHLNTDMYITTPIDANLEKGLVISLGYNGVAETSVMVGNGVHAYIAMSAYKRELVTDGLSFFPKPCSTAKETEHFKLPYTRKNCALDCWFKAVADKCQCSTQLVPPEHASKPYCEPDDIENCVHGVLIPNWEHGKLEEVDRCTNACKKECTGRYVTASTTYSKYPSPVSSVAYVAYRNANSKKQATKSEVEDNFVVIDLYFESLTQTVVELYPKVTLEQLISNIGGQLGLWLGASIITFYEAMMTIFVAIKSKRDARKLGSKSDGAESLAPPTLVEPVAINKEVLYET